MIRLIRPAAKGLRNKHNQVKVLSLVEVIKQTTEHNKDFHELTLGRLKKKLTILGNIGVKNAYNNNHPLIKVKGVQKKFSNFNFNYKLPFNGRVDDEKIKADIEEEWFKRRRSLFEYNEFNDIEEISQGKCDIVNRAVINNRIQFAFKRLIDKRTLKIEKDDKKKDCK
ncbi:unnamed protein product [Rhizophagus irregularis]|nr:unnamed protein product [Rhizophagus irregularis]